MKIPCPHCTKNLPYNHLHAGKSFQCGYCKKPFVMPPFEKLPPEFQNEYRKEFEKRKQIEEAERKKKETSQNIAHDLQQQSPIRPQEEPLGQLFNLEMPATYNMRNSILEEAQNKAPENDISMKSYATLRKFPRIFKIVAGIGVLLSVIYLVYNIFILASAENPMEILFIILPGIIYNISAAAIAVLLFMFMAQLNVLIINVADDLKASKALLIRLASTPSIDPHHKESE